MNEVVLTYTVRWSDLYVKKGYAVSEGTVTGVQQGQILCTACR